MLEGQEVLGCRAMVGCGYPTAVSFSGRMVTWTYRSPLEEKFALAMCEEIEWCHVDEGHCVVVGQEGRKVTALLNVGGGVWNMLAGRISANENKQ